jgi:hypothetical protein
MFCEWSAEFDHLPIGDETGGLSTWELLRRDHSDRAGSHPPQPRWGGTSGLVACLGVWARYARWNYGGADLVLLGWWTGDDVSVVSLLRGFASAPEHHSPPGACAFSFATYRWGEITKPYVIPTWDTGKQILRIHKRFLSGLTSAILDYFCITNPRTWLAVGPTICARDQATATPPF